VVIVDDNFIGDKNEIKYNLLPAMKKWMQSHSYPFVFNAETSVNLADDEELMSLMVESGFTSTFVGIETPEEKSLQACNKKQNSNRDLLQSVRKMQNAGLPADSLWDLTAIPRLYFNGKSILYSRAESYLQWWDC
jgi:radical SAM superfamily enzyme YgiQ (UPF0313 family)